ncbi:efflux transporter outer membrane subunit [Legionella spiritensis]|uniref:efflux transporter outer membrane subunit n=1 Tax=Legionella spiritensis TaxID=452 RepID=UPI000F6DE8B5|nr:efflux transporter outer membrane subunit [Legionella spiritensis]VEG92063.1 multidrug efflux MFS outer membrane protein [Legionella spiritensis]
MKGNTIPLFLLFGSLLTGCTVGPDYKNPELKTSSKWSATKRAHQATSPAPVNLSWWKEFNDPLLNEYIRQAANNNLDIKIARARILEARALRQIDAASFYPQINAQTLVNSLRISKQGRELGFFPNFPGIDLINRQRPFYSLGFDSRWELDLFGKTRRAIEAREAEIGQAIESERNILLSVVAEVARNYVELRGTQREIRIRNKNLALQRKTLRIVRQQYEIGSGNELDVALAESQLKTTESSLPNLTAQIYANAYQIAVLLGKEPQAILKQVQATRPLQFPRKPVPIGLRSDILCRRPDVREAERQLAAATAEIGVATAELFPQFNLIGDISLDSVFFDKLFNKSSGAWTLGPSMNWPVFQGGRIRANIKRQKIRAEQAGLHYWQTILNALKEAETALVRYGQELDTKDRLFAAVKANRHSFHLARQRYKWGEDDILALIDTERALNNSESEMISSETRTLTNLISLYKTLGGGWETLSGRTCDKKHIKKNVLHKSRV